MRNGKVTQAVYLLSLMITPVIFLLTPQIAYDYGMVGVLQFTLASMIGISLFILLRSKFIVRPTSKILLLCIELLFITEALSFMILVTKNLWTRALISGDWGVIILLFTIVFMIIYFLWRKGYTKSITVSVVGLGMIASFLIPSLVYLNISIPTVYSGLHFLAPSSIKLHGTHETLLFFVFILVTFSIPLLYLSGTVRDLLVEGGPYRILPALLWSPLPISLGSLAFVAQAQAIWPKQSDQVGFLVIEQYAGQFGKYLFIITLLAMMIYLLLRMHEELRRVTEKASLWCVVSGTAFLLAHWPGLTILELILGFGMVQVAILPLFFLGHIGEGKEWFTLTAGVTVAILILCLKSIELAILTGAFVSTVVGICFTLSRKERGNGAMEH
ncbi:hypothetical protein [Ammoniphilus sp. CFH 90114]|uniref:hypothetical protein n=1 Tax=Ammoniphilus sp. CFH 90114 TaxID=2493665 RepID=UPI00100E2432|nr:hypothetical protein [Ammoniphilus sp. CFH 90114]RXT07908.1 hypothetical protein EIZ39_10840 [Ammoniphilus sp. CFH 90114]